VKELNKYIDHTLLKPTATPEDIVTLCKEAREYNFYSVCVNSCYAYLAANELSDVDVTIGFPLGASVTEAKVQEARIAVQKGADEIDMVINIGFLKAELYKSVREEISAVKKAIGRRILKVIIETCYLSNNEKKMACEIVKKAGADFVKTSTGFGEGGANLQDIQIIRAAIGDDTKIKASGGIKTKEEAIAFIKAGVSRIGTSRGVALLYSSEEKQL
jgi:deoxyribose-phosphate aldolase